MGYFERSDTSQVKFVVSKENEQGIPVGYRQRCTLGAKRGSERPRGAAAEEGKGWP